MAISTEQRLREANCVLMEQNRQLWKLLCEGKKFVELFPTNNIPAAAWLERLAKQENRIRS